MSRNEMIAQKWAALVQSVMFVWWISGFLIFRNG